MACALLGLGRHGVDEVSLALQLSMVLLLRLEARSGGGVVLKYVCATSLVTQRGSPRTGHKL